MGEIVELKGRRETGGPNCTGEAHCLACGHDWIAVVPTGTTHFECPECQLMRGAYRHAIGAPEGARVFQCNCGSEEFFFKLSEAHGRTQIICTGCGDDKPIDDVFPR